jgi:hypothetical protein
MGAALAAVLGQVAGVAIAFVGEGGDQRGGALSQLRHVRFESLVAVRKFPSVPGQRSVSGAWWCATTETHVGFESWLERDHVMLLDFDPLVGGCRRSHSGCPDPLVVTAANTPRITSLAWLMVRLW